MNTGLHHVLKENVKFNSIAPTQIRFRSLLCCVMCHSPLVAVTSVSHSKSNDYGVHVGSWYCLTTMVHSVALFFFKKDLLLLFFNYVHMGMSVCEYVHVEASALRPEEGVRSLGVGAIGGYEQLGANNQTWILCKSSAHS